MNKKIKVVIADDHSIIREGIRGLLELEDDIEIVGEASDGEACVEIVQNTHPDVLLLDISMPKMNGLDALQKIKDEEPDVNVIILSIHDEAQYYHKAVSLGASGYVLKDSDFNTLYHAIHRVYDGGNFVDPKLVSIIKVKKEESADISQITRREKEILLLIAQGLSNKDIAAKLNVSEKTIKNHTSNLFKKINVSDRTQAAIFAIKNEML